MKILGLILVFPCFLGFGMNLASCSDQHLGVLWGLAEHKGGKCVAVLDTHQVVEDGVEGGVEIIEEAREIHEILVDSPVDMVVPEIDIAKPLDMVWGPGDEEQDNH